MVMIYSSLQYLLQTQLHSNSLHHLLRHCHRYLLHPMHQIYQSAILRFRCVIASVASWATFPFWQLGHLRVANSPPQTENKRQCNNQGYTRSYNMTSEHNWHINTWADPHHWPKIGVVWRWTMLSASRGCASDPSPWTLSLDSLGAAPDPHYRLMLSPRHGPPLCGGKYYMVFFKFNFLSNGAKNCENQL